ncbi:MAG: hypothetical protein NVSMB14_04830 [Isosphaeraceae bacterium]
MPLESRRARLRFVGALLLFVVWVVALSALALMTGKKPPSARERTSASRGDEVKDRRSP